MNIYLLFAVVPKCNHLHYLLELTVAYLRFLACKVIEECRIGEGAQADPLHLHRPRTHRHSAVKVEGLASLQDPQQTAVTQQGVPIHSEGLQTVDRVEGALFQSLQVVGGEVEDPDLSEASKGMGLYCHQPCAYHDELLEPQQVSEGPGFKCGDGIVGEVEVREVHHVLEGSGGDGGDVSVGDGEPVEIQALETKRRDVLQVRPVIDIQTPQVGELAKILVLQGRDTQVTEAKCDQAAEVGQRLARNGCQIATLYCEIL